MTDTTDRDCGGAPPRNVPDQCAGHLGSDDARLFGFESELEANLTYIPIAVRFKLDKCGIKLSLTQWQQLPLSERRNLLQAPCANGADVERYGQVLLRLIKEIIGGDPERVPVAGNPAWKELDLPRQIADKALLLGIRAPLPEDWRGLTDLQRFALLKVSRAGSDNRNLVPALREFGML